MSQNDAISTVTESNESARAAVNSALAVAQSTDLAMIRQKASLLVESGFLPRQIETWQQAAVIILRGRELNIPDWTALQHISVVNGNPQPDAQLMLALVQRSGLLEQFVIVQSDTKVCKLRIKRKRYDWVEHGCTIEEAAEMKTKEKDNWIPLTQSSQWRVQPKTKLFYFTVKQVFRRLFSDVLNGMAGSLEGDLQIDDVAMDAEFVELEGDEPTPVPLSVSPSAASDKDGDGSDKSAAQIGSLDMLSLYNRAKNAQLVENEWHFNNTVKLLLREKRITERASADAVLDAIRAHKAEKEFEHV